MRRMPDRTVIHAPSTCGCCGNNLDQAPVVGRATRQVLEVPEPRLEIIDHVASVVVVAAGPTRRPPFPPRRSGRCAGVLGPGQSLPT